LGGVPADYFTVAGADTVNNASDSGTITAVFPATGTELPRFAITVGGTAQNVNIFGAGEGTEVEALTEEEGFNITYGTGQYGAVYAYFEVDFGAGKTLADYGKLTLKWKGVAGDIGWKNFGVWVSEDEFSGSVTEGSRAGVQNFASSNTTEAEGTFYLSAPTVTTQKAYIAVNIWAGATGGTPAVPTSYDIYDIAFSAVVLEPVTADTIVLAAPIAGAPPVTTINAAQYSGTVEWDPEADEEFAISTVYTATITLIAKIPYTFDGVDENFFTVEGADSVSNEADSGVVTVVFPETAATALTAFPITIQGATGATTEVLLTEVTTINADVTLIEDGYQHKNNQGNQYQLAKFTINLGDKTLSDFASVTLNFHAVEGDYGYKRVHLLVATTDDGLPTAQAFTAADYLVTNTEGYGNQTEATGTPDKAMTLTIRDTLLEDSDVWDANELEIAIWADAPGGLVYQITNIVFVAKP
jgi:hypothetical protein